MISEDKIKELWMFRNNIHDGDLMAQLYDLARAIEAEATAPLKAEIARLKNMPMKYRRMEFNAQLQEENKQQAERSKELEAKLARLSNLTDMMQKSLEEDTQHIIELSDELATANALIEQAREALIAYEPCILKFGLLFGTGYAALNAIERHQKGK